MDTPIIIESDVVQLNPLLKTKKIAPSPEKLPKKNLISLPLNTALNDSLNIFPVGSFNLL
jgi:hypothetical protein